MSTERCFIPINAQIMTTTISDTLRQYISNGYSASIFTLGDDFAIIENPTFSIIPNHPYRNPLIVAVYCTAGNAKGRINAKSYHLQEGSFMIVLPGQITELANSSIDFSASYVVMPESLAESLGIGNTFSLSKIVASSPYILLEGRAREALEGYLLMCKNTIQEERNPNRLEIIRLLTRAFFLGLGYFIHKVEQSVSRRCDEVTKTFISLVEQHYIYHRELSFYAEKLNLTSKHLSRAVKKASGKSATEWIEKYVILDSITQLLSSSLTIKEIAYRLNFPSQSCFGKFFYRIMGVSPLSYRNNHK